MKRETGNILEWVQTKMKIVDEFSSVAINSVGIELTRDQELVINAKREQLKEIEDVIIEFMSKEDDSDD